jgi:hypothetical protein
MGQVGHVDPKVTLSIYAQVMFRGEGERERLEALVNGSEPLSMGTGAQSALFRSRKRSAPEEAENPADSGAFSYIRESGRSGHRGVSPLSRPHSHLSTALPKRRQLPRLRSRCRAAAGVFLAGPLPNRREGVAGCAHRAALRAGAGQARARLRRRVHRGLTLREVARALSFAGADAVSQLALAAQPRADRAETGRNALRIWPSRRENAHGRGWFRTSDLSRVKRALSH